tara:strand:+ start:417 stop:1352 length:936 start_codon:yes stop_codon:yes gene_type:complete
MNVVTVFGGSGFVGRYAVQKIARTGARVRVAVRRPDNASFLKPMGNVGQIVMVQANIRDANSVAAAIKGADTVINLVGILFPRKEQTFENVQVVGAERVASLSANAGVKRLIHVSAISADGYSNSEYASSKGNGEEKVRKEFPGATILKPSLVFGREDNFFNQFASIARIAPALPLFGGGNTKFQPIYVGDVANAITHAALNIKTKGKTYELGGPSIYNFKTLMQMILTNIDRRRILVPVPFPIANLSAAFLERFPFNIITRDQIRLLQQDNVVTGDFPNLNHLGIKPTALEAILPTYLRSYRRGVWQSRQ